MKRCLYKFFPTEIGGDKKTLNINCNILMDPLKALYCTLHCQTLLHVCCGCNFQHLHPLSQYSLCRHCQLHPLVREAFLA